MLAEAVWGEWLAAHMDFRGDGICASEACKKFKKFVLNALLEDG